MTVKELIIRLLNEPMNAEIKVQDPTPHTVCNGLGTATGYVFDIDGLEHFDEQMICINFIDWRNKDADNN